MQLQAISLCSRDLASQTVCTLNRVPMPSCYHCLCLSLALHGLWPDSTERPGQCKQSHLSPGTAAVPSRLLFPPAQGHAIADRDDAEGDTLILKQGIIEAAQGHCVLGILLHDHSTRLNNHDTSAEYNGTKAWRSASHEKGTSSSHLLG